MKKSSLGRRSSLIGTGRISNADKNSNRNLANEGKKSFIPKPSFSKYDRASSVEREPMISSSKKDNFQPSSLRRSRSFLDLRRSSISCQTPIQFGRRITAGGSTCGRPSSMGGPKSARKESRPIADKSFQIGAQTKVQEFFLSRCPELLDKGSIKPMTAGMFAELVNFLMQKFDKKMVITRANITEEVPNICKMLNYKGKAEKSWLLTVNAPHSWPYVVSFLLWLVEINLSSEVLDLYEALYPEKVEEEEVDPGEINFKLLVPHLLKGYKLSDDTQEMNEFIEQFKESLEITEEDNEILQKEYGDLQKELNESEDTLEEEKYGTMKNSYESLKNDIKKCQDFIYDTENYVSNVTEKRKEKMIRFDNYEKMIESLKEERERLRTLVASQDITPEYKEQIDRDLVTLREEIRQLNDELEDYQNVVYKTDMDLVGVRNQFNKSIQAYNKEITVNLASIPNLKNVLIEGLTVVHTSGPTTGTRFEQVDFNMKELRTSLKNEKRDLEMEVEKQNIALQKMEDQLTLCKDEEDKVSELSQQLENDITRLKKTIAKDKDLTKAILNDTEEKIKQEREKIEQSKNTKEEELIVIEQEFSKKKRDYDEVAMKMLEVLKNKKMALRGFEVKLQEITRTRMMETKKQVDALLNA